MSRIKFMLPVALLMAAISCGTAASAETGRIKRRPPDAAEAERIASETIMNDRLLRNGDIIVTDRGFFVFRGVGSDGYTFEFSQVPNPIPATRSSK
jgi:hypothetical protein